jgi:hypothetical protein
MEIQTVNEERFVQAEAIVKDGVYRFDLSPASATATAIKYDFITGWHFGIDGTGEVIYSASEIREKLEAKTIWKKLGK